MGSAESIPRRKRRLRITPSHFLFAGPAIILFFIFKYYPLLSGIRMAFVSWTPSDASQRWIGLQNFVATLGSPLFWEMMANTAIIFLLYLALSFWVPIVQSLLLSQIRAAHRFLRFLFVLPAAIPNMVNVIVWRYIWDPTYGIANGIMALLHGHAQKWLGDPSLVKPVLVLPGLLGGGLGILIYLAAVQNISEETIEAAVIDGASAWQRIWRIVLPEIRYMVEIQLILAISTSLLQFDYVYAMTKGGPGRSSTTVVMGMYFKAFSEFRYSEAAAWSLLVTLISALITYVSLRLSRQEANWAGAGGECKRMKAENRNHIREPWQDAVLKTVSYCVLVFWLLLLLFPVFWLFSSSLKDVEEGMASPPVWLPRPPVYLTVRLDYSKLAEPADATQVEAMARCDLAAATLLAFDRFGRYGLNVVTAQAYQGDKLVGEVITDNTQVILRANWLPATTISVDYLRKNNHYEKFYTGALPRVRFDLAAGLQGGVSLGDQRDKRTREMATSLEGEQYYGKITAIGATHSWLQGAILRWRAPFMSRFYGAYPPFQVFLRNSAAVTTLEILLTLLVCSMAAFALSRIFRRTAQRIWLLYFLISLMIPGIATLVPGLFLAKDLHIFNTFWGIILFSVPNAFIVYILKGFIDALPGALFDAARMEGANEVTVFLRLVIPLSKSALAVAVIMLFLGSWNNFFWPFVVISDPNRFTFPVGLFFFTTQGLTYYGVGQSFTYGIVSSLPTIVIFLLFQNQIQKGLVWSGIKG